MTTDDASPGRDPRESIPMCCDATIGMVRRQRIARRCPVCREWYYPATEDARDALLPAPPPVDVPAPVRPPTPGAQPDARVQVADDVRLRPSSTAPVARLTHTEDDELVRVRRLLCELRPDRGGPLGWAADGAPPAPGGSAWTPALRVQTSVEVPAILPGAFASTAPLSRAPDLDRGYPGMPDDVRATLRWCQRSGTLMEGLRAFYTACALSREVSTQEQRDAWAALPEGVRPAARVVYGRKRVQGAMAAWWGEGAVRESEGPLRASEAERAAWDARWASERTGEALARVRGRVSAVVASGRSERMKVLQPGRPQQGWSTEATCTGKGNGDGGCGARLLVEEVDLFATQSHARDETDTYTTFECAACTVWTDISRVPRSVTERLPFRLPSTRGQKDWRR